MKNLGIFLLFSVFSLFIFSFLAYAHETGVPHVETFNITLIVAFLGGALMLLSPCSFSLLPAYFAYSVYERKKILLATFVFFLGFAFMFSLFGMGAGFIGYYLSLYSSKIAFYSGIALVVVGIFLLFGKSIPIPRINIGFRKTVIRNFLFGMMYSFGYAGCAGPILVGILLLATTLPVVNAVATMFSYALGLGLPLMVISYFFDRFKLFGAKFFVRPIINFKNFTISAYSLISSILFITIGYVYIAYNSLYPLNLASNQLTDFSYSLQQQLMELNIPFGDILFFLFLAFLFFIIFKESGILKNKSNEHKLKKRVKK